MVFTASFIENLNSTLKHGPANSNLILQLFLTSTISNKLVYERLFRVFALLLGAKPDHCVACRGHCGNLCTGNNVTFYILLFRRRSWYLTLDINKVQPLFADVNGSIFRSEERSYVSQRCLKVGSSFGRLLAYAQLICCLLTQSG